MYLPKCKYLYKSKLIVFFAASFISWNMDVFSQERNNVILIIGDGLGVAQWHAGLVVSNGDLNLKNLENIGLMTIHSETSFSAGAPAHGTSMATGMNSYDAAVSVDTDTIPLKSIVEYADESGLSTGIVSANTLLEGSIAPFIAHEVNRMQLESIAASYLRHELDVLIGGGRQYFTTREDGRNLVTELREKGYQVYDSMDSVKSDYNNKFAVFTANGSNPSIMDGRGTMFPDAVQWH
jgi:alkaline phosphatase